MEGPYTQLTADNVGIAVPVFHPERAMGEKPKGEVESAKYLLLC